MNGKNILLGLAPWAAFTVLTGFIGADNVGYAALAACVASLVLGIAGAVRGGVKILDVAGVVTFGVVAVLGFTAGIDTLLVDYARGAAALVLGLVMLVSAYTVPFTEQYAREHVDRRYWGSPVFRDLNRRISLVWAQVVLAMAGCHLTAGYLHVGHGLVLNWGIPVVLILWGVKRTEQIGEEFAPANAGSAA